ncbi:dUTP diphosphatase [Fictibacillus barbaricus]|uniref:Dimeric dUTPase (All-alpha-NTP-PPase superfamily) n=1 Tax=Fictibacillus barbaricus TaxID=182136 RepID=A0ABU1U2L5_9BACL|nr:dUTP diphosphatase [Fictibacillus barbaricus]MDR7073727.1 dimeric dUTPase (all-alpha-NTP-PPase superfamily) [Fictibacillus barbaricus]
MNIQRLFSMQKELNSRIVKEHQLKNEELYDKRRLAFLVELGELANETRCFKYWSKKSSSSKETVLEEYVDGLHFVLSIGLDLEITDVQLPDQVKMQSKLDKIELTDVFLSLYQAGSSKLSKNEFVSFFEDFMRLGTKLGFSYEEIEAAYLEKNLVNHERQNTGY